MGDAYYYGYPAYGYRSYGAYPYYRSYGYHAIGKRSADAEPAADADAYYYGYAAPYAYRSMVLTPTEPDTTDTGKLPISTKDLPSSRNENQLPQPATKDLKFPFLFVPLIPFSAFKFM